MRVGDYELLEEIGRGGAGRVLRARAPDGREVALKLLLSASPGAAARFLREQRLQGGFGVGEGFVPLLDAGEDGQGRPFLVMPLLGGGSLSRRLTRGTLTVEEARALGIALGRALGAAHARGVVHRDVKPGNVLFDGAGRPLLADLGLARHFSELAPGRLHSVGSRTGEFRGTPGYVSPEQLIDAKRVGPPTDVFALGVLLFEALSGRMPFAGPTLIETALQVESGRFESLRSLRPDVPEWLATLIERALAPDPARRPADGEAFARALEAGPGPAGEGQSAARARRAVWLAAGGVLLLGALVAGGVLALRRGAGREPGAAGNTAGPQGGGAPQRGGAAPAPPPAAIPPELGALCRAAGAPLAWVWGDDGGWFPLPVTALAPVATPAGEELALLARPRLSDEVGAGGPWLCAPDGARHLALNDPDATTLAVSADGSRLLTGGPAGVRVWTLPEGRSVAHWAVARPDVQALALSADGRLGAVACGDPLGPDRRPAVVQVWDLERNVPVRLLEGLREPGVLSVAFFSPERVVALGLFGEVQVWEGAQPLRRYETRPQGVEGPVTGAIDAEGRVIVTAFGGGARAVHLWGDEVPLAEIDAPGPLPPVALVAAGGQRMALADVQGGVWVRGRGDGWRRVATAHTLEPRLAFLGERLVIAERDLRAIDLAAPSSAAPSPPAPAPAHRGPVRELLLTPDGARLLSLDDQDLLEWDARAGGAPLLRQHLRDLPAVGPQRLVPGSPPRAVLIDAAGAAVWTREASGWRARTIAHDPEDEVLELHVGGGGAAVLELLADDRVRWLDLAQADVTSVGSLPTQGARIAALQLSEDAQAIVLETWKGEQLLVELTGQARVRPLRLPFRLQGRTIVTDPPRQVVCGDYQGALHVADLDGTARLDLPGRGAAVSALARAASGAFAAADQGGRLLVWRPGDVGPRWQLDLGPRHDVVTALAFASDGRTLLAGTRRGLILGFELDR